MLFCVIALCALVGVATALDEEIIEPIAEDDFVDLVDELEEVAADTEELEEVAADTEELEEVAADAEELEAEDDLGLGFEKAFLIAAQELLTEGLTEKEIDSILKKVFDSSDDIVMVYIVSPKGVIEAIYPDKYSAARGDFIARTAAGAMTLKAREFFQTEEYTSAREGILGFDAVQPIITDTDEYLGAVVAKFSV